MLPPPQAAGRYSQWSMGSIPNQGTRIPHAAQHGEKEKKKKSTDLWKEGRKGRKEGGGKDGHCPPRAGGSSRS